MSSHAPFRTDVGRILHVAQPTVAGVPTVVADLAARQASDDIDVYVACPVDGDLHRWLRERSVPHIPWVATREPGASIAQEIAQLVRIIGWLRPDVVHLHSSKAGLAGRLAIRGRRPTVFQPHSWSFHAATGGEARAARIWERIAARWTTILLCVSEAERAEGLAAGVHSRFRVVENGVDLARFSFADDRDREAARVALDLPPSPLAAFVGRLVPQKGVDVLLDAWSRVSVAVPDARLAIIGTGPEAAALRRSSSSSVRFVGARRDVPLWLAAANVVVLPSRWEGMPLVVLEAMATGRSVVATDVAGVRESLGADAGAIVPPENARALADAVARRLSDPALAAREGRAGRSRAEEHCSSERVHTEVLRVYSDAVQHDGRPRAQ